MSYPGPIDDGFEHTGVCHADSYGSFSQINIPETTSLFVSSVTVFELLAGATDTTKQKDVHTLLDGVAILPFDMVSAAEAGKLYRELYVTNTLIEIRDIFIAATARANGLTIMALNYKHFARVEMGTWRWGRTCNYALRVA